MEDRSIERAYPQRHEHVANLAHGGVGQHALDIGLGQSRKGRQQQRHRPDHADQQEHIRGQQEQAIEPGNQVHARRDHGRRVDQR